MMFCARPLLRYPYLIASAGTFFDGTRPVDSARRGHSCADLFCHANHSTRARPQESDRRQPVDERVQLHVRAARAGAGAARAQVTAGVCVCVCACAARHRSERFSAASGIAADASVDCLHQSPRGLWPARPHPRSDDMISAANRCGRTGLAWPDRSAMPHRHPAAPAATSAAGTRCPGRAHRPARRATPVRAAAGNRPGRRPFPCHANCMTPDEPVRVERA